MWENPIFWYIYEKKLEYIIFWNLTLFHDHPILHYVTFPWSEPQRPCDMGCSSDLFILLYLTFLARLFLDVFSLCYVLISTLCNTVKFRGLILGDTLLARLFSVVSLSFLCPHFYIMFQWVKRPYLKGNPSCLAILWACLRKRRANNDRYVHTIWNWF